MRIAPLLLFLAFAATQQVNSQDKVGDFTRSPIEHIINEIDQPFVVRSVVGTIILPYGGGPIAGVLFEIRGPGTDRKIRRCKTDDKGRFMMGRVPEGTYRFKATLGGFQSEMGTIVVSRKTLRTNEVKIVMPVGV